MRATAQLLGQTFIVHAAIEQAWSDVAGIYLLASRLTDGDWSVDFVGHCGSFRQLLFKHAPLLEAMQLGSTHVLTLAVSWPANRELIGGNLIKLLRPVLNDPAGGRPASGRPFRERLCDGQPQLLVRKGLFQDRDRAQESGGPHALGGAHG